MSVPLGSLLDPDFSSGYLDHYVWKEADAFEDFVRAWEAVDLLVIGMTGGFPNEHVRWGTQ